MNKFVILYNQKEGTPQIKEMRFLIMLTAILLIAFLVTTFGALTAGLFLV